MSVSYRDSLNLPTTSFPMKAGLSIQEPLMIEKWENIQLYQQLRQLRAKKKRYILHDGPPYANGHLHLGHAVNKILKDIIVKSKTLEGLDAPFVPGWDCHGLPIELNVEKQFKAIGKNYTPREFRIACRNYANQQIDLQRKEFIRLGILADWYAPYTTMDFQVEADIIRTFKKCMEIGYIEPGFKPVHWCVACQSALAELEIEYQDKVSKAIDVKFQVQSEGDSIQLPGKGTLYVPIWTTTPWTLPANEAVALGPEIEYVLIQIKDERWLIATACYENCLKRYCVTDYKILKQYLGKELQSFQLLHPFESRTIPLVLGNYVATDVGTGAVHIAPMHGPEDYALAIQYQLPLNNRINTQGYYEPSITELQSQSIFTADKGIIDLLQQHNALLHQTSFRHSYPHCWRHKKPLIFLATPQWFLRLQDQKLHKRLEKALKAVQWHPGWGEARMRSMLGNETEINRPNWCLSRQRYWGVPLPLLVHKTTQQLHPKMLELLEIVAEKVEREGIEAWYALDIHTLIGKEADHYQKLEDVLDVWFDSGVTHETVLKKHPKLNWPADLYLEGNDQFRGWFQSSLLTSILLNQKAPYHQVSVHGFTVDKKGHKMSKSLGNTVNLDKLVQKWGADILRLWIASIDTQSEILVSEESFKRTSEAYRRIRNTFRFLLGNLHDFDPEQDCIPIQKLLSLDRWLLVCVQRLQTTIEQAYQSFNFHLVYQIVHQFCIQELGSFYLSVLKDRQYTMQANSLGRRSGQTVLYYTLETMLRWLAPILSFTSEEVWSYMPWKHKSQSIFLTEWYKVSVQEDSDLLKNFYREAKGCEQCWKTLFTIRNLVNQSIEKARDSNQIGSALEANLTLYCVRGSFEARLLSTLADELHYLLLTSTVTLVLRDSLETHEVVYVEVTPVHTNQKKCVRCWHHRVDTGLNKKHPDLCTRCIQNIEGSGEIRQYA